MKATQRLHDVGQPFASIGTKNAKTSDVLYVRALAAPLTVNTIPEATLEALADHGEVGATLVGNGGDYELLIAAHARAGDVI